MIFVKSFTISQKESEMEVALKIKISLKRFLITMLPSLLIVGTFVFFLNTFLYEPGIPSAFRIGSICFVPAILLFSFIALRRKTIVIYENKIEIFTNGACEVYYVDSLSDIVLEEGSYAFNRGMVHGWYFIAKTEGREQKIGLSNLYLDQNAYEKAKALESFMKKEISLIELSLCLEKIDSGKID